MNQTTAKTAACQAAHIRAVAAPLGVTVEASTDVLTVSVQFAPGDRRAYYAAEVACLRVLGLAPMLYPGSTWGTDSGSVGGAAGLAGGYCRLNKSGVSRRLTAALARAR